MRSTSLSLLALAGLSVSALAEPQWIWLNKTSSDGEKVTFKTTFKAPADFKGAALKVACDNGAKVFLNGKEAADNPDWSSPTSKNVKALILAGQENTLTVEARNQGGLAGLLLSLSLKGKDGDALTVETNDKSWQATLTGKQEWKTPVSLGKYGTKPWGLVFEKGNSKRNDPGVALKPEEISAPPGFAIELLYTVPKDEQGSWVALTTDPKGRVIACDQYGSLYQVTPPAVGSKGESKVEHIDLPIDGAHGLLYAFDSLYFMRNEGGGDHGVYRVRDTNGDDKFDEVKLLRKLAGSGEHGCHSMVVSPDGKSIYINAGNHTNVPEPLEHSRAARIWNEDHVIKRMWDANGHARGKMAPGGYICDMSPDGSRWDFFCYGFRNEFDIAFNEHGELFTYDADMEWDIGSPWYRPTRINHCVSGADYGWRSGSGKWPTYYPDSLPAVVDIGPGSPTGVVSGQGSKFPARYQRAIFANDWTYGTMYAIHLTPKGASYEAKKEEFIFGKPLPLTDVVINPNDGAMYFAIGGRRTQSALYRCVYKGSESTAKAEALPLTPEFALRRELEALHKEGGAAGAVEKALPALSHEDRYVRYAARVALEHVPVSEWRSKVQDLTDPNAIIESTVALARVGNPTDREPLLQNLAKLASHELSVDQHLAAIRALQLIIIRLGKPEGDVLKAVLEHLEPAFPSKHPLIDRELCATLVALGSTSVVSKAVQLMATATDDFTDIATASLLERNAGYAKAAEAMKASMPNKQQIWYAFCLREATEGWTPALWRNYFSWFPRTTSWQGGNSFRGFLNNTRTEALANVPDEALRKELDALSTKVEVAQTTLFQFPKGPGRAWTLAEALAATEGGLTKRNFQRGEDMFKATSCATCHRFNGSGGSIGPDLTGSGNRYTMRDFLENIIDPSKVISDQYETHEIKKTDGSVVIGRVMGEEGGKLNVSSNPFAPQDLTSIPASEVASKKPYTISMMPPGLINALSQDELLDLVAYVMSGGDPQNKAFKAE
ncbi:MAG: c-type cytochrome [Verrucomicrobiaceae bacterium]|nr:c-type cytochrome [Verrucomicrobiaceae bacterium]